MVLSGNKSLAKNNLITMLDEFRALYEGDKSMHQGRGYLRMLMTGKNPIKLLLWISMICLAKSYRLLK